MALPPLDSAHIRRVSLISFALLLIAAGAGPSLAQGIGPHYGVGVLGGEDVGLDDGYATFGAFVPLMSPVHNSLLFGNANLLLYNEQSDAVGGNVGGGLRFFDPCLDRIFGGYVYYDFRDRDLADYSQVGFGLETLGAVYDARLNVNLPTDTNNSLVAPSIFDSPAFGGSNGQNIILGYEFFQQALRTVDLEVGAMLLGNTSMQLKGYLGTYGLFADGVSEWGGRGRLEVRAYDRVWVGGFVQNDGLFGTTGGVTAEFRFGRGCAPSSYCCTASRLGDPVQRRQYIAVRDIREDILATQAGVPITVLHVDSNAAPGGTGGIQDPVDNLFDASNQPQDIVFVHGDSVFVGEEMAISTEGQRFLGEGIPHLVNSDQGTFLLPSANPAGATPQILDAPSVAVYIAADDAEVSGFEIDNATNVGIYGNGVGGFDVNRNRITRSNLGVGFENVTSAGLIEENIANDNVVGFAVNGDNISTFNDNIADGNDDDGFVVFGNNAGTFTNNSASDNGGVGFSFDDNTGTFTDNTATSNDSHGFIYTHNTGTFTENTATGNEGNGFNFSSNSGTFTDNTATNNENNGFSFVDNDGTFEDNTADDNDENGYSFNDNNGTFANNSASENGDSGFIFNINDGSFSQNTATDNETGGFSILLNLDTITSNTATGNRTHGFFLFSGNNGTFTNNIANYNSIQGTTNGFTIVTNNGTLTGNSATGNGRNSSNVIVNVEANGFGTTLNNGNYSNNTSTRNANNGFSSWLEDNNLFNQPSGTFSDNVSNNNGDRGYRVINSGTASSNTGSGNVNGGNTFP